MWDLYRDNDFTKIFIPTCTTKKIYYQDMLTVYVKIVFKICGYIYIYISYLILIICNNIYFFQLKDFL